MSVQVSWFSPEVDVVREHYTGFRWRRSAALPLAGPDCLPRMGDPVRPPWPDPDSCGRQPAQWSAATGRGWQGEVPSPSVRYAPQGA